MANNFNFMSDAGFEFKTSRNIVCRERQPIAREDGLDAVATNRSRSYRPRPSQNPVVRGPEQYIVSGIFGSIAFIALLFRLYTRAFTRQWFGIDDWLMIVAMVACGRRHHQKSVLLI